MRHIGGDRHRDVRSAIRLYDKIGALGSLGMSHEDEQAADTREIVREEVRQVVAAISALRAEKGES